MVVISVLAPSIVVLYLKRQDEIHFFSDLQIRNYKTPMMVWYKWLTLQQLDPQDYHPAERAQIKNTEGLAIPVVKFLRKGDKFRNIFDQKINLLKEN